MPKKRSVHGDERKEELAARVVAASEGLISVPEAMKGVKMATPIRTNDSVRRRVHRRSQKLMKEGNKETGPDPPIAALGGASAKSLPSVSTISNSATSEVSGTSSTPRTTSSLTGIRTNLHEAKLGSTAGPPTEKKKRRSTKTVQADNAEKLRQKKIKSQGMKLATTRIFANDALSPTNPNRKTHQEICDEVN